MGDDARTTVKSRMSLMFGLILGQPTRLSSVVVTAFVSLLTCISGDQSAPGLVPVIIVNVRRYP